MGDMTVSVSIGLMKAILGKLATLMGDEYKKIKGLRKEVSFLKCELSGMNALLEKMNDVDQLDPQARNWRKEIIEMSYNIEDYIDNFMDHVGEVDDNVGVLQKASHYLKTFKHRHRLANQFQEIKTLMIDASERRKRYMLDQWIPSTTRVVVDPRLSALYQKSERLVGIASQKEEIVKWVMDEEQQLKVMSIVGFGGLGKTTLANEVYREVGEKFDCKVFISISQNPDITKLLNSLMLQLKLQPYCHVCEPVDLINNIIKHLKDKRYFIIVDDLWDIRAWNTISCAFPQNNHYSRVMVTTRIENVARASCGNNGFIHYMKPLSQQDSRKLFFDRICESEDACPPDFIEVSCKILKKCGGLPLAIITMASMIACQPTKSKWLWAEYIQNSLGVELATNPTYEDMMHIIDFSYKSLPSHLKACFLYLGVYPEDHEINRVALVRRWVAEGLICCSSGQDVWDVGESYFSELVNRSMLQPAYENCDSICIEMTHCRVHDMMLELILRKCREDNFLSLMQGPQMILEGQDNVIRRLIVDLKSGDVEGDISVATYTRNLSQVRSLNIFRGKCRIFDVTKFRFLRVLFLDVCNLKTDTDLSVINHLSKLRYLKVVGRSGNKVLLPDQIRGMQVLETLDFSEMSNYSAIPDIVDVPCLSHVSVRWSEGVRLPDRIGNVKSLLTLNHFSLQLSSLKSITDLGKLTALRELTVNCFRSNNRDRMPLPTRIDALINSLEKLSNLRGLVLSCGNTVYCGDAMLRPSFSPLFRKIEVLSLRLLIFSGVPKWISDLRCLRQLRLGVKEIHQEDFNVIGSNLVSLIWLSLEISHILTENIMIGGSTGFKCLKIFRFDCDGVSHLTFEEGAMPDLNKLELEVDPDGWDRATPVGLQHLPNLKRINVLLAEPATAAVRTEQEWSANMALMKSVFQEAVDALPTHPEVSLGCSIRPKQMRG